MNLSRLGGEFLNTTLLTAILSAIAASNALAFSSDLGSFSAQSPAVITDNSRNPLIDDDFLREIYVPPGLKVTTLGKMTQKRAFFGNSRFYAPPLTPAQIADYAGGTTTAANDLVVMRCKPKDTSAVDPELAIWPNVAKFLVNDITPPQSCQDMSTPAQAWCIANSFQDTSNKPLILSLYNAISLGKDLMSINNFDGSNLLYDYYGIGYGHSGIGFVVKGSASGDFTATQTLVNSVVPEYLLENVTLSEANCRCVQIPAYPGRDGDSISINFVWNKGRLDGGACNKVSSIGAF